MKLNFFNRKRSNLEEQIEGWSDIECLKHFLMFIPRVGIGTQFVQNDVGFITHQVMEIQCGDQVFVSNPRQLDWPLEPVAFPEEHKGRLN